FVGIYWNNHHHLIHAAKAVNGAIMWANLHWLFWLSLIPFLTAWLGQNSGQPLPAALYGVDLFMAGISYTILVQAMIAHQGRDSELAKALGSDLKSKVSVGLYASGIALALFISPWLSYAAY